jgi:hypothetical protein
MLKSATWRLTQGHDFLRMFYSMRQIMSLAVLAFVVGCGGASGPAPLPLYPVTGSLIVGGKKLDNVIVQLIPATADSKGKPGIATTDAEGKFVIRTNGDKGANPGKYKVVLGSSQPSGPVTLEEATKMSGQYAKSGGITKVTLPYPSEWAAEKTTPKEVDVTDQPLVIDIDI